MKGIMKSALLSLFALVFVSHILNAATYYASPFGGADADFSLENPGSLQAAVKAACTNATRTSWSDCDTVVLLPGTYDFRDGSKGAANKSITGDTLTNNIVISRNYIRVISQSRSPTNTIIMGAFTAASKTRAFALKGIIEFSGITVSNFYTSEGSGSAICCADTTPVITNCIFTKNGNGYARGGAVYKGSVYNSKFLTNGRTADKCYGAGTYYSKVYNSYYKGNQTGRDGGAARYGECYNCIFDNNLSDGIAGGAVSNVKCTDCVFINNKSKHDGSTALSSTLINCVITNSSGAVAVNGGKCINTEIVKCKSGAALNAVLVDCLIENNVAEKKTPGLASCTSTNCIIRNNTCTYAYNTVYRGVGANGGTHYNALFENNTPAYYGEAGGVYNAKAINCKFIKHKTRPASVGMSSTLINCTIENNSSSTGPILKGGKYFNCSIIGNSATNSALFTTGVYNNCLIVENSTGGSTGGDIASASVLDNSTLANNMPKSGKGGLSGNVSITNSIFHSNGAYDLSSGVTALNCLYYTTNGVVNPINCIVASDPLFRGEHLSPERPYSLRASSLAIDAGTTNGLTLGPNAVDFYGRKRFNNMIDIGCAEYIQSDDPTRFTLR